MEQLLWWFEAEDWNECIYSPIDLRLLRISTGYCLTVIWLNAALLWVTLDPSKMSNCWPNAESALIQLITPLKADFVYRPCFPSSCCCYMKQCSAIPFINCSLRPIQTIKTMHKYPTQSITLLLIMHSKYLVFSSFFSVCITPGPVKFFQSST